MTNKKMTLKYWNSLEEGSRKRALMYVFPIHRPIVDMLMTEKPEPKENSFWKLVWKKVRIPENHSHYKTVVNQTYIP